VKGRNTPLETAKTARKRCRGNEEKELCIVFVLCYVVNRNRYTRLSKMSGICQSLKCHLGFHLGKMMDRIQHKQTSLE